MVHSAVKRKRSSEEISASEDVSREHSVALDQSANDTSATIPPPPSGTCVPPHSGPEDPRPTVLALLHFLSDIELFTLVTTRLAQASPWDPPLFLTPLCIAGLHGFLLPLRPPTESIPTSPASSSPFTHIPTPLDETGRIRARLTGTDTKPLLVAIATLVSFLSPHELRLLVQARISGSQAPHHGVGWFLEFMQSGGDGVPRGKMIVDNRRGAKRREKKSDESKVPQREPTTEIQPQVSVTDSTSSRPTATPPADFVLPCDDVQPGLEDGEISASEQPRPAAPAPPTSGPAIVGRKKEKKKVRNRRGARKYRTPQGSSHSSLSGIPASAMTTIIAPGFRPGQTAKLPFPGMGTPFFVEPFRPPPHHPALAGSQTSFQI